MELNIKAKKTRPYRSQTDRKIERFHGALAGGGRSNAWLEPRDP
ncbi:hypothetical protein [Arthrobacter terrae]